MTSDLGRNSGIFMSDQHSSTTSASGGVSGINELIAGVLRYARGAWRHRRWALFVSIVVGALGGTIVFMLPDIYEAKATFYVDANSRLRTVVSELGMEPNVDSRIYLVRQAMMGRPQLEEVVRENGLDRFAESSSEQESLLADLHRNIRISTGRHREAQNLFAIEYRNKDRDTAVAVVDSLLTTFVEDVLDQKNADTERTKEFLSEQMAHYRQLLEDTETNLQRFRRDHPAFVVGDRGDYFARMQALQASLDTLLAERGVEESRRSELRRQLASVNPNTPSDATSGGAIIPGNATSSAIAQLETARQELLVRYTDRHPDVISMNVRIDALRQELKEELARMAQNTGNDGARTATNPVYIEMQIALSNSNLAIAALDREIAQTRKNYTQVQTEVNSAPQLENEFVRLNRDYQNYQRLYNEVSEQAERERIGRVGEEKDVISFNIINPPAASLEPVAPNRLLLALAVLMGAVGCGVGIALFLYQLKPSFQSVTELRSEVGLPVMGLVTLERARPAPADQSRRAVSRAVAFGLVVLGGCLFMFMPLDAQANLNVERTETMAYAAYHVLISIGVVGLLLARYQRRRHSHRRARQS